MKVLHVIPSLSPALGGPTHVALQTVKAIRSQGIDAEIVTTSHDDINPLDIPLASLTEYKDVPVWFLPVSATLKEYIFSTSLTKWLWQNIAHYDLLDNHYLFSYAPSCAAAIARYQKIPYTVRTQGQLAPWALRQSQLKKQIYTLAIERHNLQKAAAIHCTTQQEAINLRNFGISTPTVTLPLGVEPTTPILNARSELHKLLDLTGDRQIILFLSRLHPKKRPELLIAAFQQVIAHNPDCHLIMAGSGETEYVQNLQRQVKQYNLGDRTTFTGFVTGDKKNLLLQGADIFALPSYSENFGIAVAEAMAAGLPVIVTPGVQISTDIAAANAGIIIDSQTELVTAINQLIESPEKRSHLAQNAIKLAQEKYSWDIIATQLIRDYKKVVKR
ncbi:MAG: glycosyltransferase [Cyanobacteria bacterium J06600_6]